MATVARNKTLTGLWVCFLHCLVMCLHAMRDFIARHLGHVHPLVHEAQRLGFEREAQLA